MKLNSSYLSALQAVLFVVFLVITAWFNRFAADDFYFIGELSYKSFSEVYKHLYFNWHGRWTSNLSQLLSFKFSHFPGLLFILNIFTFGILINSIYQLVKTISMRYSFALTRQQLYVYAILFLSVFFFCSVSPSSTWFWHTSTVVYLWSVVAFLYLINIIIKQATTPYDYLTLILASIYLGGTNEPLVILSFIICAYSFYHAKHQKTVVSFVLILGAFLINYFSSGTAFRDNITPSLGIIDLILYVGYGTVKFLLFTSYKTFLAAITLAIPFYLLGKKIKSINYSFKVKKEVLLSVLAMLTIVILNQFIVIYALGGLAPDRATTASSIVIAVTIVRFMFLLGQHHKNKDSDFKPILLIINIGLIVFIGATSVIHYRYANAYDERLSFIENTKESPVIVKPLPFSGYIYSAEITNDSQHYSNQHLKSGLGLKQEIVLK